MIVFNYSECVFDRQILPASGRGIRGSHADLSTTNSGDGEPPCICWPIICS